MQRGTQQRTTPRKCKCATSTGFIECCKGPRTAVCVQQPSVHAYMHVPHAMRALLTQQKSANVQLVRHASGHNTSASICSEIRLYTNTQPWRVVRQIS
jgi:hypothetical protein